MSRPARFWHRLSEEVIQCDLCPHFCKLKPGVKGRCLARAGSEEGLISLNYGLFTAVALDPIEKKPLYHFHPGSVILSVGSFGCNLNCPFCQNWQISRDRQSRVVRLTPDELVDQARQGAEVGSIGVAFTYNEPLMSIEYLLDVLPLLKAAGQKRVLVTNGMINPEPWQELLPLVDAVNLDIKAFTPDFYSRLIGGKLDTVLEAAKTLAHSGVHLEITTLLVPGENDDLEQIEGLVRWIAKELGPETPIHFSRYFPNYRMHKPPTSLRRLKEAVDLGRKHLRYVYAGNAPELGEEYTTARKT
ncbi:MAG: AmmeMemoRadiSam system radical SAM enzyme [Firmicutes bacterium]|nr:AmmeMemoRadiSam system radical SAM enzyme [Bacillota bacterium]